MSDMIALVVEILNDALERDPEAMTDLINLRADCNAQLATHPTIQVQKYGDVYRVGVLGILNGVLGGGPSGDIGAKGTVNSQTGNFLRIKRFVDLRVERLDVII
ncbi:MAG: hypothetical protein CMF69_12925 [Magnetovibrio sp.]|nr:hypothetical protein [Magnetovibrio sp.]